MTSQGRPLPKFGEWDVNNPASADGFTVIFAKARDEKKTNGTAASSGAPPQPPRNNNNAACNPAYQHPSSPKKRFCCF